MLESLSIKNVVLIDNLELVGQPGLTVMTGETGAGKSIILDALGLVLGDRADVNLIRYGQESLSVTAVFTLPDAHAICQFLKDQEIPLDDGLILKRTLTKEGKSRAFINGEVVPLSCLRQVGQHLAEIHGQFSSYQLLDPKNHLSILDRYGHLTEKLKETSELYKNWQDAHKAYQAQEALVLQAQEQEEYLRQVQEDLVPLKIEIGEEEELITQRKLLLNSEKIKEDLALTSQALSTENHGVLALCYRMQHALEHANSLAEEKFMPLLEKIGIAVENLLDAEAFLQDEEAFLQDSEQLKKVEERLYTLKDMGRKYHLSVDELPAFLDGCLEKLNSLSNTSGTLSDLQEQEKKAEQAYRKCAQDLHQKRLEAAQNLMKEIQSELPALKLLHAQFVVQIEEDIPTAIGTDKVFFMASTNAGTPLAPLNKIASGGELARFMLALEVHLAKTEEIPLLVFDEVDTGVSGATADAVGKRLKKLAEEHQVFVITHAPQVASYGTSHLTVSKEEEKGKIVAHVYTLSPEERVQEIARMLAGEHVTESAYLAAQGLLGEKK